MSYPTKRISFDKIDSELFCPPSPVIYEIEWEGIIFEILVSHVAKSESAVVFGTGSVLKDKPYPIFSRAMWQPDMTYNALWYFDPTLYDKKLALAWYYGNNERWYLKDISIILEKILQKLGIRRKNTLCFGSSGGGFSSILLSTMLKTRAFVINPQLFALNFYDSFVEDFIKNITLFGHDIIENRVDAFKFIKNEKYIPNIFFCINKNSSHDMNNHYIPFIEKIKTLSFYDKDKISTYFIDKNVEGDQHNIQLSKEETLYSIYTVLKTEPSSWNTLKALDLCDTHNVSLFTKLCKVKKLKTMIQKTHR